MSKKVVAIPHGAGGGRHMLDVTELQVNLFFQSFEIPLPPNPSTQLYPSTFFTYIIINYLK